MSFEIEHSRKKGFEEGVKAERDRVLAVCGLPEGEGRSATVLQCIAFGLTPEKSVSLLKAIPKQPPNERARLIDFSAAMADIGNPNVRADSGCDVSDDMEIPSSWDRAFKSPSHK